jgi:protein translocase SecG subunit
MRTLLIILLILVGIIFVGSVLLMSPKWGLGAALGWLGGWDEYGSKKSLEWKLKKVALVSACVFIVIALILPFVN